MVEIIIVMIKPLILIIIMIMKVTVTQHIPTMGNVSNDKGGKMSVTKSHHT